MTERCFYKGNHVKDDGALGMGESGDEGRGEGVVCMCVGKEGTDVITEEDQRVLATPLSAVHLSLVVLLVS